MKEAVKFRCPACGAEWVEMMDREDEWFGLATDRTLCGACGKRAIDHLIRGEDDGGISGRYPGN